MLSIYTNDTSRLYFTLHETGDYGPYVLQIMNRSTSEVTAFALGENLSFNTARVDVFELSENLTKDLTEGDYLYRVYSGNFETLPNFAKWSKTDNNVLEPGLIRVFAKVVEGEQDLESSDFDEYITYDDFNDDMKNDDDYIDF